MLTLRSSQDFACCARPMESMRPKYLSAFFRIRLRQHQDDFASNAIDVGLVKSLLGCFY